MFHQPANKLRRDVDDFGQSSAWNGDIHNKRHDPWSEGLVWFFFRRTNIKETRWRTWKVCIFFTFISSQRIELFRIHVVWFSLLLYNWRGMCMQCLNGIAKIYVFEPTSRRRAGVSHFQSMPKTTRQQSFDSLQFYTINYDPNKFSFSMLLHIGALARAKQCCFQICQLKLFTRAWELNSFFSLFRLASPRFYFCFSLKSYSNFLKSETDEFILKSSSSRLARLKLITHRSEQL